MVDLVDILETHCTTLGWEFSYGKKSNINLLKSNKVAGEITMLLDPVSRSKNKNDIGGTESIDFNGEFLLVVKSNLDEVYHNQKGAALTTGKYKKNIEPLLTALELLENLLDCSDYKTTLWEITDTVNALDVNMDGVIVTFKINIV